MLTEMLLTLFIRSNTSEHMNIYDREAFRVAMKGNTILHINGTMYYSKFYVCSS